MKRLMRKLLQELAEKLGIQAEIAELSVMLTPVIMWLGGAVALFIGVRYILGYMRWEGEQKPTAFLMSGGFLILLGAGLIGYGFILFFTGG